jgi:hypothetical protein
MRMKKLLSLLLLLPAFGTALAQDHYEPSRALTSEELFLKQGTSNRAVTRPGQRYLALDAAPLLGAFRRYRYFPGDDIKFRLRGDRRKYTENIYSISDSTFSMVVIDELARQMHYVPVPLKKVRRVKTFHRIPWVTEGAFLFPVAGLVYAAADFINPGIDNQRFTTDTRALGVAGGLMATGLLCYKMSFPSHKINDRNRLKVLQTY